MLNVFEIILLTSLQKKISPGKSPRDKSKSKKLDKNKKQSLGK